jgi:hypothetical protein
MRLSRRALAAIGIGTVYVAIGVILFGPWSHGDPIIDGWSVGDERGYDAAYIDAATEGLATSRPGHAAIVRVSLHNEGEFYKDGHLILNTRTVDCCAVAVFELADGTRHAVGVGYPGLVAPGWTPKPMAFPNGPH